MYQIAFAAQGGVMPCAYQIGADMVSTWVAKQ